LDREPGSTEKEVYFPVKDRHRFPFIKATVNDEADNRLREKYAITITSESADASVSASASDITGRPCTRAGDDGFALFEDVLFQCSGIKAGGSAVEVRALRFSCEGPVPVGDGRLILSIMPSDCVTCLLARLENEGLENRYLFAPRALPCGSPVPSVRLCAQNTAGKAADLDAHLLKASLEISLYSPSGQLVLPDPENRFFIGVSKSEDNEVTLTPSNPGSVALTEAGQYAFRIVYTERRPELLMNLPTSSRTLTQTLVLEVEPGAPHRLQIKDKPPKPIVVHVGNEREVEDDEVVECLPTIAVQVADQYRNTIPRTLWKEPICAELISSRGVPCLDELGRRSEIGNDGCALFSTLLLSRGGFSGKCAAACRLHFTSGQLVPDAIPLLVTDDIELKKKIAQATEELAARARELAQLEESLKRAELVLRDRSNRKAKQEAMMGEIKKRLPAEDRAALESGRTAEELIVLHQSARDRLPPDRKAWASDRSAERKVNGMPGFYGLLCDLAEIENEDKARVISWYLGQQKLDMVVCRSNAIMALADVGDGFRVLDMSLVKRFGQAEPGKLRLTLPHGDQDLPQVGGTSSHLLILS
jgi:hypothetical protein